MSYLRANHQYWWPDTVISEEDNLSEGSSASVVTCGYDLEIGHS